MSTFYLSDPLVLNELRLQDDDFRIYQHCCRQFNVKTFTVFIRLVDIAGQFQMSVEQVQLSLARMTRVRVGGEPLIMKKRAVGKIIKELMSLLIKLLLIKFYQNFFLSF